MDSAWITVLPNTFLPTKTSSSIHKPRHYQAMNNIPSQMPKAISEKIKMILVSDKEKKSVIIHREIIHKAICYWRDQNL